LSQLKTKHDFHFNTINKNYTEEKFPASIIPRLIAFYNVIAGGFFAFIPLCALLGLLWVMKYTFTYKW